MTVQTFPMHDTGIGIEMGFESDAEFLAHMEAERAKLPAEVQDALKDLDAEMNRSFLFGARK